MNLTTNHIPQFFKDGRVHEVTSKSLGTIQAQMLSYTWVLDKKMEVTMRSDLRDFILIERENGQLYYNDEPVQVRFLN